MNRQVVYFPSHGVAAFQEELLPPCGPDQILCRTLYSGLSNGTERNKLTGGNYGRGVYPTRIGYQNVGVVEEVGENVDGFELGDRVFIGRVSCHASHFIETANEPNQPHCLVCRLPEALDLTHAALAGVASVAMHDVRRAALVPGEKVLVVGGGLIGQFTSQCAALEGASVTLADRNPGRLEILQTIGCAAPFHLPDESAWTDLRARGPFAAVFETTGAVPLDPIIGRTGGPDALLARNARLLLIGGRFEVSFDCNPAQFRQIHIHLAAHFEREDLLNVIERFADGTLQPGPLISDVVPVSDALTIYDTLRDHPRKLLGTVFKWGD